VTNTTGEPVRILRARMAKPPVESDPIWTRHPKQDVYGSYPILPGATVGVMADFWIMPPVREVGEDFRATIVLTDQYGNDRKIRNVVFGSRHSGVGEQPGPPPEAVYAIADPLERNVATVLKAELQCYRTHGGKSGYLGTVITTANECNYEGVAQGYREPHSPQGRLIVYNTNAVTISSENGAILLKLYDQADEEEKTRVIKALLTRLSRRTEYAPISYLILYVLFSTDNLLVALKKAKEDLVGDTHIPHKFILMLSGLLRFQHRSISDETLDDIERFVNDVGSTAFNIMEILTEIRTLRIAQRD